MKKYKKIKKNTVVHNTTLCHNYNIICLLFVLRNKISNVEAHITHLSHQNNEYTGSKNLSAVLLPAIKTYIEI